jgi:5-methylcytosine-specific restriction protein A
MTPAQCELAYATSRATFANGLARPAAIDTVSAAGVPKGSAAIVLDVYLALRRDTVFKRALADADMDRFLTGIDEDDGAEALAVALNGFARHISYRESVGHAQPGNRALYAKHVARIGALQRTAGGIPTEDPFEDEVLRSSTDAASRGERLRTALRIPRKVPRIVFVFERNPDVVAEVLERAAGVCEICEDAAPFICARDGRPYLEVHHRVPLAQGGEDTVENALAACPNCHRQQHYG